MQPLLYTRAHKVLFRSLLNGLEQYKAFSRSQCDRRLKNPKHNGVTDVFSHLSQTFNPKTERPLYTRVELGSESSLLIVAGSDTTSTCLAATFFYLLHNPGALSLAQNEIDKTFQCLEGRHPQRSAPVSLPLPPGMHQRILATVTASWWTNGPGSPHWWVRSRRTSFPLRGRDRDPSLRTSPRRRVLSRTIPVQTRTMACCGRVGGGNGTKRILPF